MTKTELINELQKIEEDLEVYCISGANNIQEVTTVEIKNLYNKKDLAPRILLYNKKVK